MNAAALALLHWRCFQTHPRPWSAAEIANLLENPLNFLLTAPHGFLIGRTVADEAELLTIAVDPKARRQGIARQLMQEFHANAQARGATEAFLEVASDNAPAHALYLADDWTKVGLRRNYYAPGVDAVLMQRDLCREAG